MFQARPAVAQNISVSPARFTCTVVREDNKTLDQVFLSCDSAIQVSAPTPTPFSARTDPISPRFVNWLRIQDSANSEAPGVTSLSLTTPASIVVKLAPGTNLPLGTYVGVVTITAGSTTRRVAVTLRVFPPSPLSVVPEEVTFPGNGGRLSFPVVLSIDQSSPDKDKYSNIQVTPMITYMDLPTGWLAVEGVDRPIVGSGLTATVSVDPAAPAGTHEAYLVFDGGSAASRAVYIKYTSTYVPPPASLTVSTNDSLQFNYRLAGPLPATQVLALDSTTGASVAYTWTVQDSTGWLRVNGAAAGSAPQPGSTPATLTLSVDPPASLRPGSYGASVSIESGGRTYLYPVNLNVTPAVYTQRLAHVADGGNWRTSIVLANTTAQAVNFTISFFGDDGLPLSFPLGRDGRPFSLSNSIPAGGARTLQSDGTAPTTVTGWAEVTSDAPLGGFAVFGAIGGPGKPDSEAAVPLTTSAGRAFTLPFETTPQAATGFAVANIDPFQTANVTARFRDPNGLVVSTSGPYAVPPRGHRSFVLPAVTVPNGSVEFSSAGADVTALGIRGHGTTFTSVETLAGVATGFKLIPHIADGGGWKTTFVLVNTSPTTAQFTLRFWGDNGAPLQLPLGSATTATVSDTIQGYGTRIIQTTGASFSTVAGSADLASTAAISGAAVFGAIVPGQPDSEAAVPLLTSASERFSMPFDTNLGYATGVALANPSTGQTANVSVTLRNEFGQTIGTLGPYPVPPQGHYAFVLPAQQSIRGTASFFSPGVPVAALGIRSHAGAFTSVRALP